MNMYSVSSMRSSYRIGGLASGLDTDSIIKDMMKIEQMKLDKLKQNRQLLEWKRDNYRDITNLLRGLKDEFMNLAKPESNMLSNNSYKTFKVTSSNSDAVTATANSDAMAGKYTIKSIDSLASPVIIKGADKALSSQAMSLSLGEMGYQSGVEFEINGQKFQFNAGTTLRQVINQVNGNAKAGVALQYSNLEEKFILQTKATGSVNFLATSDKTGTFLTDLGLAGPDIERIPGADALVTFQKFGSNETITKMSRSNVLTLDGVSYTLRETTDSPITITVEQDVDKAFDNIKSFIDKYNDILAKINGELDEKKYPDYKPLTDEQREAMKDNEIEKWEERAKSGLLKGDPILQNIVYNLRRALTDKMSGTSLTFSEIGITTGPYTEKGKLHIDETKLKTALRNNGDQVIQLFNQTSSIGYSPILSTEQRSQRYGEVGLIQRFSDIIDDNIRTFRDNNDKKGILLEKAGIIGDLSEFKNTINEQMDDLDDRIANYMNVLIRKEDRYWRQFTALEKAIERMNSQSAWLAQQFNMGGN